MLSWVILIILVAQFGLMTWMLFRNQSRKRNPQEIPETLNGRELETVAVCRALATAGRVLTDHSDELTDFEQTLQQQAAAASQADPDSFRDQLERMRTANECVESTVEDTIKLLIAACNDGLSEERQRLEEYSETTTAFDEALERVSRETLLTRLAGDLLEMVQDLRQENKSVHNQLVDSQEKMLQLVTRASSAEQIARVDALTQLPNRRAFDEAIAECDVTLKEARQPYSVILIDIDHFKSVNDKFGHPTGDAVLELVGRILRENCNTSDHVCRLGGEEFGVLLPNCVEEPARRIAERYRQALGAAVLQYENHWVRITVSCGVAQAAQRETTSNVLERADAALYSAKTSGRNQTVAAKDLETDTRSEVLTEAIT